MGITEIKFGDKFFLYGQFMNYLDEFNEYEYNTVLGYILVGGYELNPMQSDEFAAAIPGFVVDATQNSLFTIATPFYQMEMVDVTDKLSLQLPLPSGTKVWMPTT